MSESEGRWRDEALWRQAMLYSVEEGSRQRRSMTYLIIGCIVLLIVLIFRAG